MTFNEFIPTFNRYMELVDLCLDADLQLPHTKLKEFNWKKQYKNCVFPQDATNKFLEKHYSDVLIFGW